MPIVAISGRVGWRDGTLLMMIGWISPIGSIALMIYRSAPAQTIPAPWDFVIEAECLPYHKAATWSYLSLTPHQLLVGSQI